MTKEDVIKALHRAGAECTGDGIYKAEKLMTQSIMERLLKHAALIAELLTAEEQSFKQIKVKLVFSK